MPDKGRENIIPFPIKKAEHGPEFLKLDLKKIEPDDIAENLENAAREIDSSKDMDQKP
jgi:hypothetical protein